MLRHELNDLQRAFGARDVRQLNIGFEGHWLRLPRRRLRRSRVVGKETVGDHGNLWGALNHGPDRERPALRGALERHRVRREFCARVDRKRHPVVTRVIDRLLHLEMQGRSSNYLGDRATQLRRFARIRRRPAAGREFLRIPNRFSTTHEAGSTSLKCASTMPEAPARRKAANSPVSVCSRISMPQCGFVRRCQF